MKLDDINIRDPFILADNDTYYLYGTRAKNFGQKTGGFDVYTSKDLVDWSEPIVCFNSEKWGMNNNVNWAPEVHFYNNTYYMLATFTGGNGRRGTYSLVSDNPVGPFKPNSKAALTPCDWESLDGTLYISDDNRPYLVFCHEHIQIIDGSVCFVELNSDLTEAAGEPVTLFYGSSPHYIKEKPVGEHYITDGPFMYKSRSNELFMIWSTFIGGKYTQCIAVSDNGKITGNFIHLDPLIKNDGGHGMIFEDKNNLYLIFHSPNQTGFEHPKILKICDNGNSLSLSC